MKKVDLLVVQVEPFFPHDIKYLKETNKSSIEKENGEHESDVFTRVAHL